MLHLYDLSVNGVKSPAFIPTRNLLFGWKLKSDLPGTLQTSYRIVIADAAGTVVSDTQTVLSADSVQIPFTGSLSTRTDYQMTVTVCDNHGDCASESISFGTEIAPEEWEGTFIRPKHLIPSWAPYLRTKFVCADTPVRSAKLYVCGLGCGEYYLNGQKISEDLIDPPFTNYEREVFYRIYDVKAFLSKKNALTALLGDGWYAQSRVWGNRGMKYGDVCLLAQLEITYADGKKQIIATRPDTWQSKPGPITSNNLYAGETYDCRLETPGFASYDGEEDGWGAVVEETTPRGTLKLCEMPPIRILRSLPAVSVRQESGEDDGAWIIDFGENVSGFVELHIPPAPVGAQYVLRYTETLTESGTPDHRSIGGFATQCIQQDLYITRGDPDGEIWHPRFTYHGFRYLELTGYHDLRSQYGANPELSVAVCYQIATDLTPTGTYHGASEDLNRFQALLRNTFVSNYHGLPEDCPAREKCGWLGDAQIVCNTGMMNYDMEASYTKYMNDIRTSADVYHVWQMIAPGKRGCGEATPLWGCAQILIPYYMYWYYGNSRIVRDNWDLMEQWVDHECADAKQNGDDFIISRGLGDWCPPVGHESPRRIPVEESSTMMFYEIAVRMAELADVLSLPCKREYAVLAKQIKDSFIRHFRDPAVRGYSTWGTCGAALQLGLYPDGEKDALLAHLLRMMEKDDFAMPTGIYGNKYLVPALAENGYGDYALRYLFTRDHISFGTMLDDGATSVWECLEMKAHQPRKGHTSSYNHPMHTGFGYFLYAHVGGLRPLKPGFREFLAAPCRFTEIPSAEITYLCPYGRIAVSFAPEGKGTVYHLEVPENTVCHFMAGGRELILTSGQHTVTI